MKVKPKSLGGIMDNRNISDEANCVKQPKQHFKGYFIPMELQALGLTKSEQFLLAMIDSLDSGTPNYCFASNAYLAEQMELSESRVSFYITRLKKLNLIQEVSFTGRTRRLRCLKQNWYKEISKKESCVKTRRQTTRKQEGRLRESTHPSIYNEPYTEKKQQQPAALVVVFSCLENIDPSVTQKDKERLSAKYDEQTVKDAVAAVQGQGFRGSFMKTLNAACRDKWKPPKDPKEDVEANRRYAKEVEEAINLKPEIRKKYIVNAGPSIFEINQTQGQKHFYLDYSTAGFREKLQVAFRERKIH